MRIILNSDVVHMTRPLATGLARHIEDFCREVAQSGAVLVLPGTVLFENERHQAALHREAVASLKAAAATLRNYGIAVPEFDAEALVPKAELATVLRATGLTVEVVDATLEDYRDAERRASLHLAPQAPDARSDEMRDLVIWAIAVRLARQDGTAMLVSRDEVHSGPHGAEEALGTGLVRAKSLDEALDQLGSVSPAAAAARSILEVIWSDLKTAGLPIPDEVPLRRFSRLQFVADETGRAKSVRLTLEIVTPDGRLSGDVYIVQASSGVIGADLGNLRLDNQIWHSGSLSLNVEGQLPQIISPSGGRMADLRGIIEEKK